jgi:uncharacterized membrane protein
LQSPYNAFLHGVSGGMIVGFGIGLLVSVVTLAVGNNVPIPVGIWLITIFSLIVGISVTGYDAHKAVSK